MYMRTAPDGVMEAINSAQPKSGSLMFWWLGQMGFAVKTESKLLMFDPFLSKYSKRISQPPFGGKDIKTAHIIFGSHDHIDHIDTEVWLDIAENTSNTMFAAPDMVLSDLVSRGLPQERLCGVNDGESIEVAGVKITGVAAAHERLDRDEATGRYPYMSYIVEVDGFTIYHSGDTCVYDGMVSKLNKYSIDLCFLPINGRDGRRFTDGCIGNMTYQEAADLAGEIKPRLVIPGHYDMMVGNTADPGMFAYYMRAKHPDLHTLLPAYCQCVTLSL